MSAALHSCSNVLATASYDGEIVVWNTGSEQVSRKITARSKPQYRKESVIPSSVNHSSEVDP